MCGIELKYGASLIEIGMRTLALDLADDLQVAPLDVGAADRGIDRNRVDVELERRGSRLLETARVFDPSLGGRAVEARDHGNVERLASHGGASRDARTRRRRSRRARGNTSPPRPDCSSRAPCRGRRPCPPRESAPRRATTSPRQRHRRPRGFSCHRGSEVRGDAAATIGCASGRPR